MSTSINRVLAGATAGLGAASGQHGAIVEAITPGTTPGKYQISGPFLCPHCVVLAIRIPERRK